MSHESGAQPHDEMSDQNDSQQDAFKVMSPREHADPDSPMKWPLIRKVHASLVACGFTLALLFSATCYTAGMPLVMAEFGVSMQMAILPFSLFVFGLLFAPLVTPHLVEVCGRRPVYFMCAFLMAAFLAGSGASQSFTSLAACRFFAGFFGGPAVINIEGTFADVWPALHTGSYYAVLTLASYIGAALGAIVGGYVIASESWRWTQWTSMMFVGAALIFAIGSPETYPRQIIRSRARRENKPSGLEPAQNGETLAEMANLTLVQPILMFFSEPVVIMCELFLGVNFAVLFSWFVVVPAVLTLLYKFDSQEIANAFTSAIAGTVAGAIIAVGLSLMSLRMIGMASQLAVEHRLVPALFGSLLQTGALFWVGWTSKPTTDSIVPIVGTAVFVAGSFMSVSAIVSYLFDAYPPKGTLSALSAVAYTRIFCAGIVPLFILFSILNLGGGWALSIFGIISGVFATFPIILILFGRKLRTSSRWAGDSMTPLEYQMERKNQQSPSL